MNEGLRIMISQSREPSSSIPTPYPSPTSTSPIHNHHPVQISIISIDNIHCWIWLWVEFDPNQQLTKFNQSQIGQFGQSIIKQAHFWSTFPMSAESGRLLTPFHPIQLQLFHHINDNCSTGVWMGFIGRSKWIFIHSKKDDHFPSFWSFWIYHQSIHPCIV